MARSRPKRRCPATDTGILDCPPHVLAQIASDLDRASAVALALTCTQLRAPAETSIWQELNVSVHRSFLPDPMPYNRTRPLGGNRLYGIREQYIWGGQDEAQTREQPLSLTTYYQDLIKHLQDRPIRLKSVRHLYLDVDRLLSTSFVELLKLTAPTLRHLEFIPPGFPYDPVPDRHVPSIRTLFTSFNSTLSALTYLHLPLESDWDQTISVVLSRTPQLLGLRLSVEQPYSGSWVETKVFGSKPSPAAGWPVLPCLRNIEVDEMSAAFVPLLVSLVENARKIRRVCLRDQARMWNPTKRDELIEALAGCDTLEYLGCRRNCLKGDYTGGFANVKEVALAEERQPWGLPQLESVTIPHFPSMICLYSYAQMNESRSITWAWDGESRGLPPPIRPISSTTMISLLAAPRLLLIQMPANPDKERGLPASPEDWNYWGSRACFASHDRAVLIRTYEHTPSDASHPLVGREVFTHCRSYSAHHSHIDEGIIHRSDDVWEEHVDYQGLCPPGNVLAEVYAVLEESAGWKIPGRGLNLPDQAWEVLRSWKAKLDAAAMLDCQ